MKRNESHTAYSNDKRIQSVARLSYYLHIREEFHFKLQLSTVISGRRASVLPVFAWMTEICRRYNASAIHETSSQLQPLTAGCSSPVAVINLHLQVRHR